MKSVYLIGWAITRPIGCFLFGLAEPVLKANVWFKRKWINA